MFSANEPMYSLSKPPILLASRKVSFVCEECKKPGWGPPNTKVHSGKCRVAHTKKIAARTMERAKRRKEQGR
jgi:hypothetical protein